MKFFIAITLFVVVSALPRPEISASEDENPPIIFRHWEPTPGLRIRHPRPNEGPSGLNNLKELLSQLVNSTRDDDSDIGNDEKTPNDILNALKIIYEILNNKEDDDDEADTPIIDQPDGDQEVVEPINDAEDISLKDELVDPRNSGVSENERRSVVFIPRPLQLVARSTPEGIEFVESAGGVDEADQA